MIVLSLAFDMTYFRFISTMETETVASRNAIDLLLWEKFKRGICPREEKTGEEVAGADVGSGFVYGWDC